MKKLLVLLICVSVLVVPLASCDVSNVLDEIVETSQVAGSDADPKPAGSDADPKPAEEIPSGFVFTSFGDGTCALTGVYLNGDEAEVLTLPTTSPMGDKVVEVRLDYENRVPAYIFEDTFENEVLRKADTLSDLEQMQLQTFFKLYSTEHLAFQNSEVIKNDWLTKYPIIEKKAIYAFTGATAREHVTICALLDKVGFDYKARTDAVREIRVLTGELDVANERFLEDNKYPMSFGATEEIIVPEGVLSVCVSGATNIKKITLPNGIKKIDVNAFEYCSSLEEINIPDTVKMISDGAFLWCTALKNVVIPSSVVEIGRSAFEVCSSLETLHIPDGITNIPENSFADCKELRSVSIPATVVYIANDAFRGTDIKEFIFGGTQAEWKERFANLSDILQGTTVKCSDGDIGANVDDQ